MRSINDEHGVVAWIFDEYTHPNGLYFNKVAAKVAAEAPVEVKKPVVAVVAPKIVAKKK